MVNARYNLSNNGDCLVHCDSRDENVPLFSKIPLFVPKMTKHLVFCILTEGWKSDEILEWVGVFLFLSDLLFSSLESLELTHTPDKTNTELFFQLQVNLFFPIFFMGIMSFLIIFPLFYSPFECLMGLAMVATGIPVYVICVMWTKKPTVVQDLIGKL